jgi:hypothetical protein
LTYHGVHGMSGIATYESNVAVNVTILCSAFVPFCLILLKIVMQYDNIELYLQLVLFILLEKQ